MSLGGFGWFWKSRYCNCDQRGVGCCIKVSRWLFNERIRYTYNSDFVLGNDSFISQTTFICTCNQTHYMVLLDLSPTLSPTRTVSHVDDVDGLLDLWYLDTKPTRLKRSAAKSSAAMTKTCLEQAKRWPCFGLYSSNHVFSIVSVSQMKWQPRQVRLWWFFAKMISFSL